jgi:rSAM/selenodomain-associated transferase 2
MGVTSDTKTTDLKRISTVIPTLNPPSHQEIAIPELDDVGEIILVDGSGAGGRADGSKARRITVIQAPRGRGSQLAAGAAAATRDWLLFLHADTRLSPAWRAEAAAFMADPGNRRRAAAFTLAFDAEGAGPRRVAALANLRARLLGLPYGDQGLLISRAFYEALGGYKDYPLMEDVDLARRIGRRRMTILKAEAVTSAEKYRRDGWWARPLKNLWLLARYLLGADPERLAKSYR